jgi:hypothetical protein
MLIVEQEISHRSLAITNMAKGKHSDQSSGTQTKREHQPVGKSATGERQKNHDERAH